MIKSKLPGTISKRPIIGSNKEAVLHSKRCYRARAAVSPSQEAQNKQLTDSPPIVVKISPWTFGAIPTLDSAVSKAYAVGMGRLLVDHDMISRHGVWECMHVDFLVLDSIIFRTGSVRVGVL